jgi:hypothetical protein
MRARKAAMKIMNLCWVTLLAGCGPQPIPTHELRSTALYGNLTSNYADSALRATTYLERAGRPPAADDSLQTLKKQAGEDVAWLKMQPANRVRALDKEFIEQSTLWSPYYDSSFRFDTMPRQ